MARELRLILTNSCQHNCIYCHHEGMCSNEKNLLTYQDYQYIFKVTRKNFGIERVTISGGEPLLRPDIVQIVKGLKVLGAKIKLITNGVLLEDNLSLLPMLDEVCVSIASLDREKYQAIHQSKFYNNVISGLIKASKMKGKPRLRINVCCIKGYNDNKKDVESFVSFIKEHGLLVKFIEFLTLKKDPKKVKIEKIAKILDDLKIPFLGKYKEKWYYGVNHQSVIELQRCPCENVAVTGDLDFFCKIENDIFVYPEGKINPCMLKDGGLVDILEAIKQRDKKLLIFQINHVIEQYGISCPMLKIYKTNKKV